MTERFLRWRIPTRPERLAAHRLLTHCRRDARITNRVVASLLDFDALAATLSSRHDQAPPSTSPDIVDSVGDTAVVAGRTRRGDRAVNRFIEEAYVAAFEARLKVAGLPKLTNEQRLRLQRGGIGLDGETGLYEIWLQCVAKFQAIPVDQLPESAKLMVGGLPDARRHTLLNAVAVLLDDEGLFLRRRALPPERFPDLRHTIVRDWVEANGVHTQQDLEAVERLLTQDINQQLSIEPTVTFARLHTSAITRARELAAAAGFAADNRFTYYVFRCLQRIAAYTVNGRVQWRSEWLRGTRTNPRAIEGTSRWQAELGTLLREHVLEVERGHSGSNATATTYRLRFAIPSGDVDHHQAAEELGLTLNARAVPRR